MSMQQRKRDFRKCTRRALFAFFVAAATVLATFAIAPIAPSNASSETSTKAATETKTKAETKAVKNAESTNNLNPSTSPAHAPAAATDSAPKSSDANPSATKPAPKQDSTNKDADKNTNKKPAAADTGSVTDRSSAGNTKNSAEYYNPEYDEDSSPNITAGSFDSSTTNTSDEPISVKNKKKEDVKPGKLPNGTWFELKRAEVKDAEHDAYEWANFEGEQCAASAGAASENNEQCKRTKPIPTGTGVITFRPNRWTKAGRYKVHVVVHYPDSNNTTSDDATAGNSKNGKSTPVYAYVDVVRSPAGANDLNLSILSEDNENSFVQFTNDEKLILMNGKQVEHTSFDATVNLGQGNISQRMICYKKDKNGNPVAGSYKSGGINGLELKDSNVTVWQHASYEQQKKCFDNPDSGCSVKDFLYDDYVYDKYVESHPGYVARKVNEHTVGKLTGSPKESGDFACRVYALKNDIKADGAQDDSIVTKFDTIASEKSYNIADINSALENDTNLFKAGITWQSKELNITVRNMSYYYQPFYYGIRIVPEREKTTAVPISACKVGDCKKNVRSGALPDGTWFEIANYSSEKDNKIPDWAYFEGEQSNKPTTDPNSKTGEHSSENSGKKYGKITVRISAWMKPDSYKIPVIAHYPDGSSSADLDSSNEGKPIYLNVTVENHPTVSRNDLQLKVRANPIEKITDADPDSFYDDVDSNQGVTMMRGMRFLNPYLDAWSLRDVDTKISLKFLCTKLNKEGKSEGTWSSSVNGLSAGKDNKWDHVESIKDFNDCKKNPGTCITGRKLYQRDIDFRFSKINPLKAVERTDSIIGGAPTETGDYQCAVYALKPNALKKYNEKVGSAGGATSVQNGDTLLDDSGLEEGKDWTMTSFPIHVVEPFKLPKTGFAGWNMLLGGFATVSTCLMVLAFALDQTKWGRAFMKNFVYRNSARKCSEISARESGEIAAQKSGEVSARKGTEI